MRVISQKFYDTCTLLSHLEKAFEEPFTISVVSINELENIKTSTHKDESVKYKAREVVRLLNKNRDMYKVVIPNDETYEIINKFQLKETPDNVIIACCYQYACHYQYSQEHDVVFYSDDLACRLIAESRFGLKVNTMGDEDKNNDYKGFKEVYLNETDMAYFYEHLDKNTYNLLINEYIVLKNDKDEFIDVYKWNGKKHVTPYKKQVNSISFGEKIKAKDEYQSMVIDSIMNNTITAITGKAGSGKTLLSLVCAMSLIDSGKYDKLVIMFNPTKVKGSTDLGFYPGDFLEKAMQSFIGQVLITKFGDRCAVDMLIEQEKIKLVSMADARGVEIKDNEILYITECQNTSIELLKLCLSRASANCKIIIEGDIASQVDNNVFNGSNNGMLRAINILKGEDIFGFVELQNVHRSKIAELVDKM